MHSIAADFSDVRCCARKYRAYLLTGSWDTKRTAGERISDKLENGDDISLNSLVPIFGVAVDKMLALRGDTALTIRHDHFHEMSDDELIAFAVARSKCREKRLKLK